LRLRFGAAIHLSGGFLAATGGLIALLAAALFVYLKIVSPETFQSEPYLMGMRVLELVDRKTKTMQFQTASLDTVLEVFKEIQYSPSDRDKR